MSTAAALATPILSNVLVSIAVRVRSVNCQFALDCQDGMTERRMLPRMSASAVRGVILLSGYTFYIQATIRRLPNGREVSLVNRRKSGRTRLTVAYFCLTDFLMSIFSFGLPKRSTVV